MGDKTWMLVVGAAAVGLFFLFAPAMSRKAKVVEDERPAQTARPAPTVERYVPPRRLNMTLGERVQWVVAKELEFNPSTITPETKFVDITHNPHLALMMIEHGLDDEFDMDFDIEVQDPESLTTVQGLINYVERVYAYYAIPYTERVNVPKP